ncbi:MAG: hypothetical protein L7F77_03270 [Candidatus Magnetominusculus sp. LBB02]|nr:hypothetical protein [Candidatus Magnetominusculus sp. LBB02]
MEIDGWESERNSWPANIRQLIKDRQLGVVVMCGGRGRRLNRFEPKPLVEFKNGSRPLEKLIKDIPPEIPIYLQGNAEEEIKYLSYLAVNGNFNREVSFIVQKEMPMYEDHDCLYPLQSRDGQIVTGSFGLATFILHFARPPRYFFVTDGSKLGINFRDVIAALELLINHKTASIIAFTVELTKSEVQEEVDRSKDPKDHARFARVDVDSQKIYEFPDDVNKHLIENRDCPALAGMYVVKSLPLIKFVRNNDGIPTDTESVNSLYSGYVKQLKMSMVMKGFSDYNVDKGLLFDTYELYHQTSELKIPTSKDDIPKRLYVKGIKTPPDVEEYENGKDFAANYLDYLRNDRGKKHSERESKPEPNESIGLLLHCGEWEDRLKKLMLGALVVLCDNERPLTCLMKDTPPEVPIYLHLSLKSKPVVVGLLNEYRYFNHEVSYIIQAGTQLYKEEDDGRTTPRTDAHGVKIMASNGPATFGGHLYLAETPAYLIVADGNKTGLDYEFIKDSVLKALKQANEDVITLVRKLTKEEREHETERRNRDIGRRRYAMVRGLVRDTGKGVLYHSGNQTEVLTPVDPSAHESDIFNDDKAFSICGVYVIKTRPFVERVNRILASKSDLIPLSRCRSFNTLHSGVARALKMPMCLEGYAKLGGMPFLAYEITEEQYLHSIKEDSDLKIYKRKLAEGKYSYRNALVAWRDSRQY